MNTQHRHANPVLILPFLLLAGSGIANAAPEIALISGTGFEPPGLARNQPVAVGTRLSADADTIIVLLNRWDVGSDKFCEDWVIIRGRSHTVDAGTPNRCDASGSGNELGEVMAGQNAVARVRALQFSDSKSDNPMPDSLQRFRQDLRQLDQQTPRQPALASPAAAQASGTLAAQQTPADPEAACFGIVQNKIAWDNQGNTSWNPDNVKRLCKGTTSGKQPAKCFNNVMHRGVPAGSAGGWTWSKALDLCEGTSNAGATIRCYETALKSGIGRDQAIRNCETR